MTVAVQTVIRFPLYSSLTPRYLSGFDNYCPFRHFIGRFAFAHLSYSYLIPIYRDLFSYRFMHRCFLQHIIEVVWPVLLKALIGRPASIFYCSYVAFATHSTHRVGRREANAPRWPSHIYLPKCNVGMTTVRPASCGIRRFVKQRIIALYTNYSFPLLLR